MPEPSPLIPDDIRSALPGLRETEEVPDPIVHLKLFTPWAEWTWYITEFDGEDTLFGLVSGHEVELGYISLSELVSIEGPFGLRIERDRHFTPRPLSKVRRALDELRGGAREDRPSGHTDGGGPAPPHA